MNTGKRDFEFCFRKNNFCITNGFLTASTCVFCSSVRASMEEPERCDLQTAVQSPANHATSTASPINARLSRRPASEAHGDMMFMGQWQHHMRVRSSEQKMSRRPLLQQAFTERWSAAALRQVFAPLQVRGQLRSAGGQLQLSGIHLQLGLRTS